VHALENEAGEAMGSGLKVKEQSAHSPQSANSPKGKGGLQRETSLNKHERTGKERRAAAGSQVWGRTVLGGLLLRYLTFSYVCANTFFLVRYQAVRDQIRKLVIGGPQTKEEKANVYEVSDSEDEETPDEVER
jgi:hypothetical protein